MPCLKCAGCSRLEHKIDQIAAELTLRQVEREGKALTYKRYVRIYVLLRGTSCMVMLADGLLPGHRMCSSPSVACSVMEEKIDLLNGNVSRGLQDREDSAQQIKRCCWVKRFAESPYFIHIFSLCWVQ